jgi:DNA helicase-2/ATP-dependent DNA helicase PcrA
MRATASDFAVMYRTNAQSRLVEEALIRARLPYRLVGALRFYGRREIKDMIAFLRLAENPADEISLARVIAVPPRGIGQKSIEMLQSAAFQANLSSGEVLLDLGSKGDSSPFWTIIGRSASLLADFGALLADWHTVKERVSLITLFDRIISDTGYEPYINDQSDEGNDRWENIQELRRLAYDYDEKGLTEFLQNLALVSDQDTLPPEADQPATERQKAVTLLTLHAAKGLEFNQVFITGLDEGLLPHSRSRDDPEEMAEERRLFYVGMTRARDQLYLLRSERRSSFGSWEYSEPSRFLADISDELLTFQGKRGGLPRAAQFEESRWTTTGLPSTYSRRQRKPELPVDTRFKPGMRVRTAAWGEGLVLESRIDSDGEETVDVHFESVGFKRLLASLANLEIIP